ncbi:GGDEF domain-containing protein [Secundilactobacillus collinoides]|uniref:GGDEF domain-containing protein n=1 Tax=Secundilactobacillus collinoides DSM 20515 = JCM 1123 TaxID=1423733 RepID=A0A0R2BD92_SECCO|nr:GGDEF domain-containing protein [Secundilactobacillus collinoides]KRM77711.1 hypothetical protein FC82_GL003083 [Secundilactobacillus collinoides DSM 20515 = JCM 1123]
MKNTLIFTTYACFITAFFNLGAIGSLNLVLDSHKKRSKSENWATGYFLVLSACILLFSTLLKTSQPFEGILLINCQFILLVSYLNALTNFRVMVIVIVLDAMMFSFNIGIYSWWFIVPSITQIVLMAVSQRFFQPVNAYPAVTASIQTAMGCIFWLVTGTVIRLPNTLFIAMLVSYIFSTFISYGYLAILRTRHIRGMQDARNARVDPLTQAHNWLAFREDMERDFKNAETLSLITFDIDHFKQINDNYGHLTGNEALIHLVKCVQQTLKEVAGAATLYRTGGEEFTIILPGIDGQKAQKIAQRCHDDVSNLRIEDANNESLLLTISMGSTSRQKQDVTSSQFFQRADQFLYNSKRSGRDQVTGD